MIIEEDEEGYRRLVFKPTKDKIRIDVITDILQLLRYRYMITERVTFHHTRCAANAMLIKAIQLLGHPEEEVFYWMGDDDVLNFISDSDDKNIKELGEMLKYRNLFKVVFRVTSETAPELPEGSAKAVSDKYGNPEGRKELEEELVKEITKISGLSDFDNGDIAIYCPPDENMNFKETSVLVHWRWEYPIPLTELEPAYRWEQLIRDEVKALEEKYKALWNMHIFVHPKYKGNIYEIEKCCERVLGVKNDPLLAHSFKQLEDYKELFEIEQMVSRKETEIVRTARQIELGELSARGSLSAAEIKTNKEEAVNEALLFVASKKEDEEQEDEKLEVLKGKKRSKKK